MRMRTTFSQVSRLTPSLVTLIFSLTWIAALVAPPLPTHPLAVKKLTSLGVKAAVSPTRTGSNNLWIPKARIAMAYRPSVPEGLGTPSDSAESV